MLSLYLKNKTLNKIIEVYRPTTKLCNLERPPEIRALLPVPGGSLLKNICPYLRITRDPPQVNAHGLWLF